MPENDSDLRYCATATIDLLGFSAHLEAGSNDVRTTIGREAITRLQTLEEGLRLLDLELNAVPSAYPKEVSYHRINDAIILNVDLPDFIRPAVGETWKTGFSPNDISSHFDLSLYLAGEDGAERFAAEFKARLQANVEDLTKFIGLVARVHEFISAQEHKRAFPGAKTICVTGFRRRFQRSDGREDTLAANFSFANATVANRSLHGARFFVDDAIPRLVSVSGFASNIVRYACLVSHVKEFDPVAEHREELRLDTESVLSTPQRMELFRRTFVFREMSAAPLAYLQSLCMLSEYLTGTREPVESPFARFFAPTLKWIQTGPDLAALQAGTLPLPAVLRNDISADIRIAPEMLAFGSSTTWKAKMRDDPFWAPLMR
ncbi:MAG: hypothetical protein ACLQPN_04275 [Bryobacteraceae bacterium]